MEPSVHYVTGLLIQALETILREHHDVVDVGDGDRPGQGPNWAMRATQLLDELRDEIAEGAVNAR